MPMLKIAIKQKHKINGARVIQIEKALRKIDNGFLDKNKNNNYDTNESQNVKLNSDTNPNEINTLNNS